MHYFAAVAVAAASFLSLTSAVPTKRSSSLEAGFKVEQVANPNFSGRHGPSHLAKAANKYGFDLPSKTTVSAFTSAVSAAIAGVNSTAVGASPVGLNGEIDEFLSPVTIGGQQFNLDFDTGSSDLWVSILRPCSQFEQALTKSRSPVPAFKHQLHITPQALLWPASLGPSNMEMAQLPLETFSVILSP